MEKPAWQRHNHPDHLTCWACCLLLCQPLLLCCRAEQQYQGCDAAEAAHKRHLDYEMDAAHIHCWLYLCKRLGLLY